MNMNDEARYLMFRISNRKGNNDAISISLKHQLGFLSSDRSPEQEQERERDIPRYSRSSDGQIRDQVSTAAN